MTPVAEVLRRSNPKSRLKSKAAKTKWVYFFAAGKGEGSAKLKSLLGSKGANLAEMTNLGIPVPSGFTISTQACIFYFQNDNHYPNGLKEEVEENLRKLERSMGKRFGDASNPLLVSVRSGAAVSMPGMMDTILNLGLNDRTVQGIITRSKNPRFAFDAYRRFVQMFGNVVLGVPHETFEKKLTAKKERAGVKQDTDLDARALQEQWPHLGKCANSGPRPRLQERFRRFRYPLGTLRNPGQPRPCLCWNFPQHANVRGRCPCTMVEQRGATTISSRQASPHPCGLRRQQRESQPGIQVRVADALL